MTRLDNLAVSVRLRYWLALLMAGQVGAFAWAWSLVTGGAG